MASAGAEWVIQCYASSSALQMSEAECILHTYCKSETRPYFRRVAPASVLHFCFANRGLFASVIGGGATVDLALTWLSQGGPSITEHSMGNGTLELNSGYVPVRAQYHVARALSPKESQVRCTSFIIP
jgi:hypothetical protein